MFSDDHPFLSEDQFPEKSFWEKHRKKFLWTLVVFFVSVCAAIVIPLVIHQSANNKPQTVAESLTLDRILLHLKALNQIADQPPNNGSRAVNLGYNASLEYIVNQILINTDDYFHISAEPAFQVQVFKNLAPSTFSQIQPNNVTYSNVTQFTTLEYSGTGSVIKQKLRTVSQLGCSDQDFASFPSGSIALIPRGNCSFLQKTQGAIKANASAVLLFDPTAAPNKLFTGTLTQLVSIPVLAITAELASEIQRLDAPKFSISTNTTVEYSWTRNVIAQTMAGSDETVIVVGSHLDSVPAGPGINDNGSGSSTNLAMALEFYRLGIVPVNKIRFAWWGAEEIGLVGSNFYVKSLNQTELQKIALNLNFDMVASPNFIRGIYNASTGQEDIRNASLILQRLFEEHFQKKNLTYILTPFNGRSDYGPFIENGIPASGLDTGAEGIKTVEQRKLFGGIANAPYDPCYHQSCDTVDNISLQALGDLSTAAATILERLAKEPDLKKLLYPDGRPVRTKTHFSSACRFCS